MADLQEKVKWESGIYQIEENDPVHGGADGITNKPIKQLANRTKYLKGEVEKRYIEKPASTAQAGTVQLVDNVITDDSEKALTAKQGLSLKRFIDGLTRSLGNYITNSKKSNSVNSTSSDTVATSFAVKKVNDNADGRVSKNGDIMTGVLQINAPASFLKGLFQGEANWFIGKSVDDSDDINFYSYKHKTLIRLAHDRVLVNKPLYSESNKVLTDDKLNDSVDSDSTDEIATSFAVKKANDNADGRVSKRGDTMTGVLQIDAPASFVKGKKNGESQWFIGKSVEDSDDVNIYNYKHKTLIRLGEDRVVINKPIYSESNKVLTDDKLNDSVDSDSTDEIATSFAVKKANDNADGRVSKRGDTMTGVLQIDAPASFVKGKKNGESQWFIGKSVENSDDVSIYNYPYNNLIRLSKNHVLFNKEIKINENHVIHNGIFKVDDIGTENLNNIKIPGIYSQKFSANAILERNYPVFVGGSLLVTPAPYGVMQEYTSYKGNKKFVRGLTAENEWGEWKRTDEDKASITDPVFINNENETNINILNGSKFLRCDQSTQGVPDEWKSLDADFNGIQVDGRIQKFQLLVNTNDDLRIRVNDSIDSKNERDWSQWSKILTESDLKIIKRDYTKKGTGTAHGYQENQFDINGSVFIYPSGRILQTFHLKRIRTLWFEYEDHGHGFGSDLAGIQIPLFLWTAMPNKIISVNPQLIREVKQSSIPFAAEAGENICVWSLRSQGSFKDRTTIDVNRIKGGSNESIDLFITVEGY